MKTFYCILFLNLIFASNCTAQKSSNTKTFEFPPFKTTIVHDETKSFRVHDILYAGNESSVIFLDSKKGVSNSISFRDFDDIEPDTYSNNHISLKVLENDTIAYIEPIPPPPPIPSAGFPETFKYDYDPDAGIIAFPVVLKNISTSELQVAYGKDYFHLPLFIEVRTASGEWKRITRYAYPDCGTGFKNLVLKENEIIVAPLMISLNGEVVTCRVRLAIHRDVISNEFEMKVPKRILSRINH